METRTYWFIGAIVILAVLATSAPRFAGLVVLLIVTALAIQLARNGVLTTQSL